MRLDAANKAIEDYVLLPCPLKAGRYVWLSVDSLRRHHGALFFRKEALFEAIKAKLAKSTHAAPTSSVPLKKQTKQGRPRAKGSGGWRRPDGAMENSR